MAGKPKNTKAPKAEEPLDDEFPEEEFDEQPIKTVAADDSRKYDKGKAPEKKKKSRGFRLSSIDPIILASFSIFMIACLVVSGITIYGVVAGDASKNKVAEYDDSVEIYYTGSYSGFYYKDGAFIFDTDMEDVGSDNDKYQKSYSYTKKDSYSAMTMTVGQGELLDGFKNALIGHKPGDVVEVEIEDAYGTLTEGVNKFTVAKSDSYSVPKLQNMTSSDYKTLFDVDEVPEPGFTIYNVDSPYGWKANVMGISGDVVCVEHLPENNGTYTKNEVTYKVIGDVTDVVNFEYQIDDFGDNAKILKGVYKNQLVYFIKSDGTNMTYKSAAYVGNTPGELIGLKLYFVIKFVGYASS